MTKYAYALSLIKLADDLDLGGNSYRSDVIMNHLIPLLSDIVVRKSEDIPNPYLNEFDENEAKHDLDPGFNTDMVRLEDRTRQVKDYAWAIPSAEAIRKIVQHTRGRKVIELGAGSGYWASLLQKAGVDMDAYDSRDPGYTFSKEHTGIQDTGGSPKDFSEIFDNEVSRGGNPILFLCWPNSSDPFAANALKSYIKSGGDTIIYIGEPAHGCTADDEFHDLIEQHFKKVDVVNIPSHWGIHDNLYIYKRVR